MFRCFGRGFNGAPYDGIRHRFREGGRKPKACYSKCIRRNYLRSISARLEAFYKDRRNSPVFVGEAVMLVAIQSRASTRVMRSMFNAAVADARKRGAKG